MIRTDAVWDAAVRGEFGRMRALVALMTPKELDLVIEAGKHLVGDAQRELRKVDMEKVRARIARYGHANGLREPKPPFDGVPRLPEY